MPFPITEATSDRVAKTAPRTVLVLVLVACGSLALVVANWVNATFSLWNLSIRLDLTQAQLDRQDVYRLQLTAPVDSGRIFPSRIRLVDADQGKFFYTPRANSLYSIGRGLFTIQNGKSLLITFATAEKEMPAKDGAALIFPNLLPAWALNGLLALFCLSGFAIFCCVPFPTRRWKILASRSIAFARWCLESIGKHPIVVLSLPSVYLVTVYPCLWKDVDALGQLIAPADIGNIYHFPALFCFSARAVIWIGDQLSMSRPFDLLASQRPTIVGIYALVVFQQIGLFVSLGLLCKVLTNRHTLRGFLVLGLCLTSSLFSSVMLCGSEAWSLCATIMLFAFGLRLYCSQGHGLINWIGYTFTLVLAIGSRHTNLLLGFWLVGLCLIAGVARICFGPRDGLPSRALFKAGMALVLLWVAVSSNSLLEFRLAKIAGVEPRTTLGRTLSDRIDSFLAKIEPDERTSLAKKLAAATSDRNVQLAIEDQATIGSFYKGTDVALERQLTDLGFSGEHLEAERDRIILSATLDYLRTLHPILLHTVWRDFLKGFTTTSNASLAIDPFAENSYIGTYRLQNPRQWTPLDVLSSTFLPESVTWLDRSASDAYLKGISVRGFKHVNIGSIFFLTVLALAFCFWKRRGVWSRAIPAASILLIGVAEFAATMVCVYFMTRYVLPMFVCIGIALCLSIDGWFEAEPAGS
jgi:type IV secretory pathway TrbD component